MEDCRSGDPHDIVAVVLDAQLTGQVLAWIRSVRDERRVPGPAQLYAILDGARDPRIVPRIRASGVAARCLFDGELHPSLAAAAPYLVALEPDAPFSAALIADGWDTAWGVWLTSTASLAALHHHFRRFLRVLDADGRPLMFRYYDPRVLAVYLPTCSAAELEFVFGPVQDYLLRHGAMDRAVQRSAADGALVTSTR